MPPVVLEAIGDDDASFSFPPVTLFKQKHKMSFKSLGNTYGDVTQYGNYNTQDFRIAEHLLPEDATHACLTNHDDCTDDVHAPRGVAVKYGPLKSLVGCDNAIDVSTCGTTEVTFTAAELAEVIVGGKITGHTIVTSAQVPLNDTNVPFCGGGHACVVFQPLDAQDQPLAGVEPQRLCADVYHDEDDNCRNLRVNFNYHPGYEVPTSPAAAKVQICAHHTSCYTHSEMSVPAEPCVIKGKEIKKKSTSAQ